MNCRFSVTVLFVAILSTMPAADVGHLRVYTSGRAPSGHRRGGCAKVGNPDQRTRRSWGNYTGRLGRVAELVF